MDGDENRKEQTRRGPGGRFQRGSSGNPRGRPAGSRNKVTALCAELLAGDAEAIMARLVRAAKKGEPIALKLCVERLVPVRAVRDRFVDGVELVEVKKAHDLVDAAAAVIAAVAASRMTISEGRDFMALLEQQRKLLETSDLAVRIEALESGAIADKPAGPVGFYPTGDGDDPTGGLEDRVRELEGGHDDGR